MYFTDAPHDEHLGETDCCGFTVFNVYSAAVKIKKYITTPESMLLSTVKLSDYFICIYTVHQGKQTNTNT